MIPLAPLIEKPFPTDKASGILESCGELLRWIVVKDAGYQMEVDQATAEIRHLMGIKQTVDHRLYVGKCPDHLLNDALPGTPPELIARAAFVVRQAWDRHCLVVDSMPEKERTLDRFGTATVGDYCRALVAEIENGEVSLADCLVWLDAQVMAPNGKRS